jgi:hypothetical protein
VKAIEIAREVNSAEKRIRRYIRKTSLDLDPYIAHSGLINEYQRAYNDNPCPGDVKLAQLVIDGKHKFPWL